LDEPPPTYDAPPRARAGSPSPAPPNRSGSASNNPPRSRVHWKRPTSTLYGLVMSARIRVKPESSTLADHRPLRAVIDGRRPRHRSRSRARPPAENAIWCIASAPTRSDSAIMRTGFRRWLSGVPVACPACPGARHCGGRSQRAALGGFVGRRDDRMGRRAALRVGCATALRRLRKFPVIPVEWNPEVRQ